MAGAVNIRLGAIVTDFIAGFRAAGAATAQLATQLNSNLSAGFAAADRQSRQFERGIGQLGKSIQSFGRQASIVAASIAVVGITSFKAYSEINALQLGLENITGSAAGAKARFDELLPVVRLPGLGLEEAIKGDVRLQAVGFSALQSKESLLQFGNALALTGGGKFELDSVLTQLTQMGSKAKVLSEDLKPILTSSPAVAKAIKEMFGTVDSEQISAKLQAAGRSPMDFITDLTAKLSQLERVKGGPKNALENLGDAVKLAQFNFGQAADKAFGLTELIDRIGNGATGLADKFAALSPTTQKVILTVTGLVAAIGPLALAVGGLLALVPSVIAGATAITATLGVAIGPILLIGAAVVGAAVLIATNWSSIKTILTDSGIWQSVQGLVASAMGYIRAVIQRTIDVAGLIWARFGGFFTAIGKTAFEAVAAIFRFNAGIIQGIFTALTGLLTGNFSQFGNGLLIVAKSIWNLLIDGFRLMAAGIGRSIAATFQFFGATSLADKITAGIDKALVKLDGLKGNIQSVQAVAKAGVSLTVATGAKTAAAAPKPFDYSSINLAGSAAEQAKDKLKALKDEITSGKLKRLDVSAQQIEYDQLKASLDSATASFRKQKPAVEGVGSALTTNERILKRLTKELKEQGDTGDKSRSRQVAAFQELVKLDKERANFKPVNIGEVKPIATSINFADAFRSINGIGAPPPLPGLEGLQQRITAPLEAAKQKLRDFNIGVRDILREGAVSALVGMGEVIGGLIAGTQSIDALPRMLLGTLGGMLKQLGTLAIQTAIGIGAIQAALKTLNPVVAAVAGVALVALGTAVQAGAAKIGGGATAMESGGLLTGPTLLYGGETSKARKGGGEFISSVDLGANLIGDRITKQLGNNFRFNRPDMNRVGRQSLDLNVSGGFNLRNGDLSAAIDDYHQTNQYFN
ncbi:tape measure protein [Spirosoma agri]|uniref:Tape measure protein n=1 Tax=Spirosoma agri TaxID=1987381 RepID=A0A6M0IJ62_9BACT|nr:tape measure protein [Spirosoma agri]NEU68309.1 tape measure protein [Spirosoma agri]